MEITVWKIFRPVWNSGLLCRKPLPLRNDNLIYAYNKRKMEYAILKRKKNMKQKIAEMAYKKPELAKKITVMEKSMKEVSKILNDGK